MCHGSERPYGLQHLYFKKRKQGCVSFSPSNKMTVFFVSIKTDLNPAISIHVRPFSIKQVDMKNNHFTDCKHLSDSLDAMI